MTTTWRRCDDDIAEKGDDILYSQNVKEISAQCIRTCIYIIIIYFITCHMYLIFAVFLRSVCISMLSTVSLERPKHTNPSRICWAMLWGRVISVSALSTASTIRKHIDGQSCQERVRQIGTLMECPARVY